MSRKDFQLIADVVALYARPELPDSKQHELVSDMASDFADKLASTNPNFNRARFLRACGVES